MAARSLASVVISFGLVSIPVRLFSAGQPAGEISFNLLHKTCGSRLKQQYICIAEEVVVPRDEMIKGYEYEEGTYVTFSEEELKALAEQSTQTIEITEFVPATAIDPVYFDKPYYIAPDKKGAKPYSLLAEAMRASGRTAIARYSARGKQYLVQIRAVDNGLIMQQLLYADEVRPFSDIPIETMAVKEPELKLALQLIDQISSETFSPENYKDEVKERIEKQIELKAAGKPIKTASPVKSAQVIDMMSALKASIEKGQTKKDITAKPKRVAAKR